MDINKFTNNRNVQNNANRFQGHGHRLGGNLNRVQNNNANRLQRQAQIINQNIAHNQNIIPNNNPNTRHNDLVLEQNQAMINRAIMAQNSYNTNKELMQPTTRKYLDDSHSLSLLADPNFIHNTRHISNRNLYTTPENLPELNQFNNLSDKIKSIITNNNDRLSNGKLPNLPSDLGDCINASRNEYNNALKPLQKITGNYFENCFSFNDSDLYLTNNNEISSNGLTILTPDNIDVNTTIRYMDQFQYRKTNNNVELNIYDRTNFLTSLIKTDESKSIKFSPTNAHGFNFQNNRSNDRRVGQEIEFDNNNNLKSHKFIQYISNDPDKNIVYDKLNNHIHLPNNKILPFDQIEHDIESLLPIEASLAHNNQGYYSTRMNFNYLNNQDLKLHNQNIKKVKDDLIFLDNLPINSLEESYIIDLKPTGERIEGTPTNYKYFGENNNIIFEYKENDGIIELKKYYPDMNNQLEYSANIDPNNTNIIIYDKANNILRQTLNATSYDLQFLLSDTVTKMIDQGLDQSSILKNIRLLGSGFRHIQQQIWDPQQALNELNKI